MTPGIFVMEMILVPEDLSAPGGSFAGLLLLVDPLFELLANLEEGELLGGNLDALAGLGVSPCIGIIFPYDEASESADFNPAALLQFIGKSFKHKAYHINRLLFRQVFFAT